MPKKVLSKAAKRESLDVPDPEVFRVEDSIEDFISLRLPGLGTAKLDIRFLFSTKNGKKSYFRANYWQHDSSSCIVTRQCIRSSFLCVATEGKEKTLTDLTVR